MASHEQQNEGAGKPSAPRHDPGALPARGAARRRFARSGAAATGVILTLKSQSGMAALVCAAASASMSGGLTSQQTASQVVCAGRNPSYWRSHEWPSSVSRSSPYTSVFPSGMLEGYCTATLWDILYGTAFDQNKLGMYLVAAYLNAVQGFTSFMTPPMVVKIWNEKCMSGVYRPTAGVRWSSEEIVNYLRSTMS